MPTRRDECLADRATDYLFLVGTLAPRLRACDRPIAIACLRLVTFFPDRPERSEPRFRSCIALPTLFPALGP
jgi:hypothetical protein